MNKLDYHTRKLSEWNDLMYQKHPTPYSNKLAGIIERKRVETILKLCDISESDSVLEIGFSGGHILSRIKKAKRMVGLDISKVALHDASKRLNGKAELILANAEKPISLQNISESSFDVIICSQILEHVASPISIMKNISKLAKNDAKIVVSVPNELFMLRIKRFLSKTGLMSKLLPGIEPEISEWHLQVFTHNKVKQLVKENFHIVKYKRVFNVYLVYLLEKKT